MARREQKELHQSCQKNHDVTKPTRCITGRFVTKLIKPRKVGKLTDFEKYTLVLTTIGTVLVGAGLFFTGYQIWHNTRIQKEQNDWNQRVAAQKAISESHEVDLKRQLEVTFGFISDPRSLSIETINIALENEPELVAVLNRVLNVYEGYARGVAQSIYDEAVIKDARVYAMVRTFDIFHEYIDYRRSLGHPTVWEKYEKLVKKWKSEGYVVILPKAVAS